MRRVILMPAIATLLVGGIMFSRFAGGANAAQQPAGRLSSAEFKRLMNQLAEAWNTNNARRAVDLFTNDAVYSAPPAVIVRIVNGRIANWREYEAAFIGPNRF